MADGGITRGDLWPPLKRTLEKQDETTGVYGPVDLTNATSVEMYMLSTDGTVRIEGTCAIATERKSGDVEYQWVEGDTETAADYKLQFEILWSNGKTETIPNEGYASFTIQPDLAGDV